MLVLVGDVVAVMDFVATPVTVTTEDGEPVFDTEIDAVAVLLIKEERDGKTL